MVTEVSRADPRLRGIVPWAPLEKGDLAEADLARAQELVHNKTITEQTYDQRKQAKSVAEASVTAQEAMVHSAELDLNEYSELRAPVDGRIGVESQSDWKVYLWAKNLLDKNYLVQRDAYTNLALLAVTQEGVLYGAPRTFGIHADYSFR